MVGEANRSDVDPIFLFIRLTLSGGIVSNVLLVPHLSHLAIQAIQRTLSEREASRQGK
jgi:hypothetical protein